MTDIDILAGTDKPECRTMTPFSETACTFLNQLSKELMLAGRAYPDIMSFAYWCRAGNIQRLKKQYGNMGNRLGRGMVLHIAPGNIPINFAFSFAFGLLAGNSAVVRLPSRPFPQIKAVCDALNAVFESFSLLRTCNSFVRYPRDSEATAELSLLADVRLIWGGDATIAAVRQLPTKPRCLDIAFADRYSIGLLDGEAVLLSTGAQIAQLADQFYNDTYLMDQNACSSPHLFLWLNDRADARKRFWEAVFSCAKGRYALQPAVSVDKYTQLCKNMIDMDVASAERMENLLYRVELAQLGCNIGSCRGSGGYFYECAIPNLDALQGIVTEKFQTLCCFGVDEEQVRRYIIEHALRGIDRVVPFGHALDIGLQWDGYNLINMMSREIAVQ